MFDVTAIREALAKATPGEWVALDDDTDFGDCPFIAIETDKPTGPDLRIICEVRPSTVDELNEEDRANAHLIAHAPAWLGAACDRIEALEAVQQLASGLMAANETLTARFSELEAENTRLLEIVQFDCTAFPGMEAAAVKWANKISGPKGKPGFCPDPVMILEMCEEIARAALEETRHA